MHKFLKALVLGLTTSAVLLTAAPATAAPASATAVAKAMTITPLNIIKVADLDFGTVVAGDTPGTVSIDAATGAQSTTGGTSPGPGGTQERATFLTAGSHNQVFTITLGTPTPMTAAGGGVMMIDALVLDGPATRAHDETRAMIIGVGATLAVDAYQLEGDYTAEFTMSVEYF